MPTLRDVAKSAGVSTATVSATLNQSAYVSPELQERVRNAVAELGYHLDGIARSLKKRFTQTLGLLISDITNPFFTAVVRGIEDAANARGYALILCNTDEDPDKEKGYLRLLRSRRVDGLIMAPAGAVEAYHPSFMGEDIPVVFIDRRIPTARADTVVVDNLGGTRQVVDYLLRLGHRRIGVIAGREHLPTTSERIQGYRQALEGAGVSLDPDLLRAGNFRVEGGHQGGRALLELSPRPTAIFATSNSLVIGLMRAVVERGLRCPEELSVATFDDFEWAAIFHPRLTCVAQPTYEMGAKAADLLFARLDGSLTGDPREIVLAPSLMIRDSCAAPALDRP
jgi:LacI family transcriptional regulator